MSPKELLLGQIYNYDPTAAQNYTSLCLKIGSKAFFKIFSMIGHSK